MTPRPRKNIRPNLSANLVPELIEINLQCKINLFIYPLFSVECIPNLKHIANKVINENIVPNIIKPGTCLRSAITNRFNSATGNNWSDRNRLIREYIKENECYNFVLSFLSIDD